MSKHVISKHLHIKADILNGYVPLFKAIDNAIALYYTSHTIPPSLDDILISSSNLMNKRVTVQKFTTLLCFYPDCYLIRENTRKGSNSEFLIELPCAIIDFNSEMKNRIEKLIQCINKWIKENPEAKKLPADNSKLQISVENCGTVSPAPSSTTSATVAKIAKPKIKGLKNSVDKFKFKLKNESEEQEKNGGLSLLERIRLKEKKSKELALTDNPETRYAAFIDGKIPHVYDILYQTVKLEDQKQSFPLGKFIDVVSDSLSYPISKQEIEDTIKALAGKLGNGKVDIITRANITVLKIGNLDRQLDIKRIEN